MSSLSEKKIARLLEPYLEGHGDHSSVPADLFPQLGIYLDLLVRWNARTNLTAVRDPEQMVQRHFGESVFAGLCLKPFLGATTQLLDLGSGAGFPGLPIQLLMPAWQVTLAESQGKKATFLREVVRTLGLRCEVWAGRAEDLGPDRMFQAVTLRAVDRMSAMVKVARTRIAKGGVLLELTGESSGGTEVFPVPGREGSFVRVSIAE